MFLSLTATSTPVWFNLITTQGLSSYAGDFMTINVTPREPGCPFAPTLFSHTLSIYTQRCVSVFLRVFVLSVVPCSAVGSCGRPSSSAGLPPLSPCLWLEPLPPSSGLCAPVHPRAGVIAARTRRVPPALVGGVESPVDVPGVSIVGPVARVHQVGDPPAPHPSCSRAASGYPTSAAVAPPSVSQHVSLPHGLGYVRCVL